MEKIERVYDESGNRFYQVSRDGKVIAKLPSVTTILGNTKDQSGLDEWRDRIGHEEADRISRLSMNRGTIMHRLIELYKTKTSGEPSDRLETLKEVAATDEECIQFKEEPEGEIWWNSAWEMFYKFYNNHTDYFGQIQKVISAEEFLWTSRLGGWAGTVDNISELIDNKIKVIDYKNSRKPKREDWIQDYYLQTAAYWLAYWDRYGIKADGAEIWIANEIDDLPQKFTLNQKDLEFYLKEFMKRRKMFKDKFNI